MKKLLNNLDKSLINPAVKSGDRILLLESKNGATKYVGQVLEVTTKRLTRSKSAFQARPESSSVSSVNIYYGNPADKFVFVDRKLQAEVARERIDELKEEIAALEREADFLEEYDTEEEYVAAKLDALFQAHGKAKTEAKRVKLMADVLKEMKASNLV